MNLQDDTKDSRMMRCNVLVFLGCYYLLKPICKLITKDSGDGDVMCWFFWDATIFCNQFATKDSHMMRCDALIFLDAIIFCNQFAR
jgi:hypothetical protein